MSRASCSCFNFYLTTLQFFVSELGRCSAFPLRGGGSPYPSGSLAAKCPCLGNWTCHCILKSSIDKGPKVPASIHTCILLSLPQEQKTVSFHPLGNNAAHRGNWGTNQTLKKILQKIHTSSQQVSNLSFKYMSPHELHHMRLPRRISA